MNKKEREKDRENNKVERRRMYGWEMNGDDAVVVAIRMQIQPNGVSVSAKESQLKVEWMRRKRKRRTQMEYGLKTNVIKSGLKSKVKSKSKNDVEKEKYGNWLKNKQVEKQSNPIQ